MKISLRKKDSILRSAASALITAAVVRAFPDAQVIKATPTLFGFQSTFFMTSFVSEQQLEILEREIYLLLQQEHMLVGMEMIPSNAAIFLRHCSQEIQAQIAEESSQETLRLIRLGDFALLSSFGEIVDNLKELKYHRLLSLEAIPENKGHVCTLKGVIASSSKELKQYVRWTKEAKKYQATILGKKLNLFSWKAGIKVWYEKGLQLKEEMVRLWQGCLKEFGIALISSQLPLETCTRERVYVFHQTLSMKKIAEWVNLRKKDDTMERVLLFSLKKSNFSQILELFAKWLKIFNLQGVCFLKKGKRQREEQYEPFLIQHGFEFEWQGLSTKELQADLLVRDCYGRYWHIGDFQIVKDEMKGTLLCDIDEWINFLLEQEKGVILQNLKIS